VGWEGDEGKSEHRGTGVAARDSRHRYILVRVQTSEEHHFMPFMAWSCGVPLKSSAFEESAKEDGIESRLGSKLAESVGISRVS
jgi:hypothetical protein